MSFQTVQKVRRNASPLSNRQSGPVKAFPYQAVTLPCFTSNDIQRTNKGNKKLSPERLNTSSLATRDQCSPTSSSTFTSLGYGRRTEYPESLASTCSNCYLKGEWPKSDPLVTQAYFCPSNLTADKASQTPEEWCRSTSGDKKMANRRSSSVGNTGESLRDIKARLAKTSKEATSGAMGSGRGQKRASPVCVIHHDFNVSSKPIAVSSVNLPRPASQGSLDGPNQEIERLNLNTTSSLDRLVHKSVADGRHAPVAREFKKRSSVLTQTPPVSDSPLALAITDYGDCLIDLGSKDDISASPKLASFSPERLPPDGCEKILVRFTENKNREHTSFNTNAPVSTVHIKVPSEKSAFNVPLDRKTMDVPILSSYMKASTSSDR